jgi:hypothetical protein
MVALLIGVLAGRKVKRYLGKGRRVLQLQERQSRLGVDFGEAQDRFAKDTEGKPYASYTIAHDMENRRNALRQSLDRLNESSLVTLDENDKNFKEMVEELEKLEAAVKDWAAFGGELAALDRVLSDVKDQADTAERPPGKSPNEEPAFLPEGRKLLIGEVLSIDDFNSRLERVKKAKGLADSWGTMNGKVNDQRKLIEELEQRRMSRAQREQLEKAKGVVYGVWEELWSAKDSDELQRWATESDLDAAAGELSQLRFLLQQSPSGRQQQAMALRAERLQPSELLQVRDSAAALDAEVRSTISKESTEDKARADAYAKTRRTWDWLLIMLAVVLALVTGLGALYIGKPFGTLWDYVSAVAWGVGAMLALDALNAAVDKLPSLRELFQPRMNA